MWPTTRCTRTGLALLGPPVSAGGRTTKFWDNFMSRVIFLTLYIPVALFFSGGFASMWTVTVMALTLGQKGAAALLSPIFLISFFAPITLIVLAHVRGKKINNRKLIWFPITAFFLTLIPLILGLLAKTLSGPGPVKIGGAVSVYGSMIVATASTLGPLILHTVCCVIGAKDDSQDKRNTASVKIDSGYERVTPNKPLHTDPSGR
jgi:hypothetical protein